MARETHHFILYADLKKGFIQEEVQSPDNQARNLFRQKIEYLEIPKNVTQADLQADISKGAVHLKDVDRLLTRDRHSKAKYIVITSGHKEHGLLAVSYLAACYENRENGEEEYGFNELDGSRLSGWCENPYQLPVIPIHELTDHLGRGDAEGSFYGGMNFQVEKPVPEREPYWADIQSEPVCIFYSSGSFGNSPMEDMLDGLSYFSENKRVYVLCVDPRLADNTWAEIYGEDGPAFLQASSPRMGIVLHFTAEDIFVKMEKEKEEKYYGHIFREIVSQENARLAKGFPVSRVVRRILTIRGENTALTIKKVIRYALKDIEKPEEHFLKEADFRFISRFEDALGDGRGRFRKNRGSARKRMETELIGLEEVKREVDEVVDLLKFARLREKKNITGGTYHNVHMMLGAPGTAKTTVANFMGQIMMEEKLLCGDRFICINGAELKGKYVGHTAPQVKEIFDEHDIIVIDEAYSLVDQKGEGDSFSREAVAQLIIELENHSTDKLIIFAGYGGRMVSERDDRMKQFLDANPGIRSRITSTIYFPSYQPEEMVKIFAGIAKTQKYQLEKGYEELVRKYFEKRVKDRNFGNGREARSLLETCTKYAAHRVFSAEKSTYSKADLQSIKLDDIRNAVACAEESDALRNVDRRKHIGFL